jgi:endo-1,4-beta-D-glucanase Y
MSQAHKQFDHGHWRNQLALLIAFCCTLSTVPHVTAAATSDAANLSTAIKTDGTKTCTTWPGWDHFSSAFINESGRVIDPALPNGRTTSEGQAYALFFALVANDRARFAQLVRWSEDNLAGGDFSHRLPAWLWGLKTDGSWGIIDHNSASDADLWTAYTLQEAGRLWQMPKYTALGQLLADRILKEETIVLDRLGRLLLPAPQGFHKGDHPTTTAVRFNPSYAPLQLLRRLAYGSSDLESKAQWQQQIHPTTRLIIASAPRGFVADWVRYSSNSGFVADQESQAAGRFDAIRTYLWVGMLPSAEPERVRLQQALQPMINLTASRGTPPQNIDTRNGTVEGTGDAGFSAALLPLMTGLSTPSAVTTQRNRIVARDPHSRTDNYYEQALTLFGVGWVENRYRFGRDGMLQLASLNASCSAR